MGFVMCNTCQLYCYIDLYHMASRSGSDMMTCNKIHKPLVVYIFNNSMIIMMVITRSHVYSIFLAKTFHHFFKYYEIEMVKFLTFVFMWY